MTSTDSVALALTSTDSVAPRPAAGRPGRPNADADHPSRSRSDSESAPAAAPTPAAHAEPALDDSSDSSSNSEPELELLSVESKYMSSNVTDRENVLAIAICRAVYRVEEQQQVRRVWRAMRGNTSTALTPAKAA